MAYLIAFQGGRLKSVLLLVVILPFFVSFVIRTLNWRMLLSDNGLVFGPLKDLGLLDPDFHFLATPASVVFGLTYNFLPFMILPLYVALEKVDRRLIEAATDLYASRVSGLLADHLRPVAARRRRRLASDVHPGHGRLHHRRGHRRRQPAGVHGRQHHPAQVPRQPTTTRRRRLAFVLVAVVMVLVAIYSRAVGGRSAD